MMYNVYCTIKKVWISKLNCEHRIKILDPEENRIIRKVLFELYKKATFLTVYKRGREVDETNLRFVFNVLSVG